MQEGGVWHSSEMALGIPIEQDLYTRRTRSGHGVSSMPTSSRERKGKSNLNDGAEIQTLHSDQNLTPLKVTPLNHHASSFSPNCSEFRYSNIWGIISNLQATVLKQGEEMQAMKGKVTALEETVDAYKTQLVAVQNVLQQKEETWTSKLTEFNAQLAQQQKMHEEKIKQTQAEMQCSKEEVIQASSWKDAVLQKGKTALPMSQSPQVLVKEMHAIMREEQEKTRRASNIVIRGMPEKEEETMEELTSDVQSMLQAKYLMPSILLVGAHRVGRKREDGGARPIICTVPEPRTKAAILGSSRIFLKGSPIYVGEDLTPMQQAERRKKYEERKRLQNLQSDNLASNDGPPSPPK